MTCPDGSSKQTAISFVVTGNSNNGKIATTNWNISSGYDESCEVHG